MADGDNLTQLGHDVALPQSPEDAAIETVANPHGDASYVVRFSCPEFTSLCPVTGQPDTGSILIEYEGPAICRASLLDYLVSYHRHNDFHEACVERIFVDLKQACRPRRLSVYARYNRRGGIDINPFRSDCRDSNENLRLFRQ